MRKQFKILFFVFTLVVIGGLIFLFGSEFLSFYSELPLKSPQLEKEITNLIKETEKQVLTPPPLRAKEEVPESYLTQAGVIWWTNFQRQQYGLPSLQENPRLNVSAELKVEDMFEGQYFVHISPSVEGVSNLAQIVGYEFIAIGENLALGNFESDKALVQAWMDSPGHRQNILNPNYQEIGIAVQKDEFEGRTTWLSVQHFGRPLSDCSLPGEILKAKIEANQAEIEKLQATLMALEAEIRTMRPKRGSTYNQKVEQYNALILQYNNLIDQTKSLINTYNSQVKLFNQCVLP